MGREALFTPSPSRNIALGVLVAAAPWTSVASASGLPRHPRPSASILHHPRAPIGRTASREVIGNLRGGEAEEDGEKKRKRKKGKAAKKSAAAAGAGAAAEEGAAEEVQEVKEVLGDALKETDAVAELGDSIQAHADVLKRDRRPYPERTFDSGMISLGLSLGTAGTGKDALDVDEEERAEGSVEALAYYQYGHRGAVRRDYGASVAPSSASAALGNYFLHTHGGTHVAQCLLSLLASALGVACLALPAFPSSAGAAATGTAAAATALDGESLSRRILLSATKYQLMQQALALAAAKYAAGLLGAALLGASRIPQLGVRDARRRLERVASDPVGQCLFYCALLVAWMGWFGGGKGGGGSGAYLSKLRSSVTSIMNASAATAATVDGTAPGATAATTTQLLDTLSQQPPPWFLSQSHGGSLVSLLILGPVVLREVVAVLWAFSDVLALVVASSDGAAGKMLSGMLITCRTFLDAFMSVFISSDKWRKADSFQRQRSLDALVSKPSSAMELAVGAVLAADAALSFWTYAFTGADAGGGKLPFKCVLGKTACAQLYLNFLLSRRRKNTAAAIGATGEGAA